MYLDGLPVQILTRLDGDSCYLLDQRTVYAPNVSNVLLRELFTLDENGKGTRVHVCNLVKTQCTRDVTKYYFSNKVINT